MKPLQQDSEHRPGACAPGGDFLRCGESSGLQIRWTHRLKVYVPMCAFACMFWASSAFAQSDPDFAKPNEEFAQGHFKEAIAGYETLVHQGQRNANLFYDLGNAYFRTRDFGRAILNYERALALDRHHPEATANLQIARDESRALELKPTILERYLHFATINHNTFPAGVAFWLVIFGFVVWFFARLGSPALCSFSFFCLLPFPFSFWEF